MAGIKFNSWHWMSPAGGKAFFSPARVCQTKFCFKLKNPKNRPVHQIKYLFNKCDPALLMNKHRIQASLWKQSNKINKQMKNKGVMIFIHLKIYKNREMKLLRFITQIWTEHLRTDHFKIISAGFSCKVSTRMLIDTCSYDEMMSTDLGASVELTFTANRWGCFIKSRHFTGAGKSYFLWHSINIQFGSSNVYFLIRVQHLIKLFWLVLL